MQGTTFLSFSSVSFGISFEQLYFCTALSLIIMLSSHYHHHKSKTFSQLTQCPFTGTLLLLPSSSQEDQSPEHRHRSPKPSGKSYSDQDHPQHDPDPPYYREVDLSDIPSQYAEEVDTFRRILKLPDPRESLSRSSTAVMGLLDEKGRQELRPRGPSSMLPLNSVIKDAFNKFGSGLPGSKIT